MAEVTVTDRLEVNDPTKEVVVITASDNETYTSKKFGKVRAGSITVNQDLSQMILESSFSCGGDANGTVNLEIGTLNTAGGTIQAGVATDIRCTLTLYGNK